MDGVLEQISGRDEIRVENADKLATSRFQPDSEGAGFESSPVNAMNELNIEAPLAQLGGCLCRHADDSRL